MERFSVVNFRNEYFSKITSEGKVMFTKDIGDAAIFEKYSDANKQMKKIIKKNPMQLGIKAV